MGLPSFRLTEANFISKFDNKFLKNAKPKMLCLLKTNHKTNPNTPYQTADRNKNILSTKAADAGSLKLDVEDHKNKIKE